MRKFISGVRNSVSANVGTKVSKYAKAKSPKSAVAKVANYTPEQTADIVNQYSADQSKTTVEKLALFYGKSTRSIVAKLVREKVYVSKVYVTKTGKAVQKKDSIADAIGAVLRLAENDVESLTKATKPALEAIFAALANSKPIAE